MANVDAPFGLKPLRYKSGAPYNGAVNVYSITDDTNAIFVGDPVFATGAADSDGIEIVDRKGTVNDTDSSTNTAIVGVVVGFASSKHGDSIRDDLRYVAANETGRYALVADDPDLIFAVQEDSVGGALAVGAVGNSWNLELAAGDTVTGLSGVEIDSSATGANGSALSNVRILRLSQQPKNALGANAVWEVEILNHRSRSAVAGA